MHLSCGTLIFPFAEYFLAGSFLLDILLPFCKRVVNLRDGTDVFLHYFYWDIIFMATLFINKQH